MKRTNGISLITLIITIIVIIILAAIVIFTGLNTPDRAQFAKFAQEFSGFQEAVTNTFLNEKMKLSTSGQYRTDEQIYYKIATGEDTQQTPPPSGTVADLGFELQGEKFYQITSEEIAGVKVQKKFIDSADNLYITDKGEVFALPGFLVEENGTNRWYVDASHYYEDETGVDHATTLSEKGYAVGQAVAYEPFGEGSYTTETTIEAGGATIAAGTSKDTTRTTWRIFSIDNARGIIKITPGVVNGGKVTLSGPEAYYHPEIGLNEFCNTLYKNTKLGLPVTNMTYQELNEACHFTPSTTCSDTSDYNVAFYKNGTDLTLTSGETVLGRSDYSIVAEDDSTITVKEGTLETAPIVVYTKQKHSSTTYAFYQGNGEIMYGGEPGPQVNGHDCIQPYEDGDGKYHPVFVRSTCVYYSPSNKESALGNVLGNTYGWLASPCVGVYSSNSFAYFSVRLAFGGSIIDDFIVAYSNVNEDGINFGLLPVVTLTTAHLTGEGSVANSAADPGDDANPWGIR